MEKNPGYFSRIDEWQLCRDSYAGETNIKSKTIRYLSPTPGMEIDGMAYGQPGYKAYQRYLERAVFHNYVAGAVETMIGLMHSKPPSIELPAKLEYMRESATKLQESLETLLRKINFEQILLGRAGLMVDMNTDENNDNKPYISLYSGEKIINWDYTDKYQLIVIDESGIRRTDSLSWNNYTRYRILSLGDINSDKSDGKYYQKIIDETDATEMTFMPKVRGFSMTEIPFVMVNSMDLSAETDIPPLLSLAQSGISIYRSEADYRQTLFQLSQDTLVISGVQSDLVNDDTERVGAGSVLILPKDADAKFIGVSSSGISEQRAALENDKAIANNKSAQLIDNRGSQKESAQALQIRSSAQTATLNQIASTGATALQKVLQYAAMWLDADESKVVVSPNADFIDEAFVGRDLVDLMQAKNMGAPLSNQSIHNFLLEKGYTSMNFERELELMDVESNIMLDNITEETE